MEANEIQGGNMIVQHNIAAMNAGRMLLITSKKKSDSLLVWTHRQ